MSAFSSFRRVIPGALALAGIASTAPAVASDLSLRGALPVGEPIAGFDWTGARIGVEGGYVRGGKQDLLTRGMTVEEQALIDAGHLGLVAMSNSSFTVGGGIGYDYQLRPGSGFVFGAVADWRYTNLQNTERATVVTNGTPFMLTARQRLDDLGTVRARVGYAFDRVLVYGTVGFAYGHANLQARTDIVGFGPYDAGSHKGYETGYVYGGGIEIAGAGIPGLPHLAAADNLSFKVEYLRYDLGRTDVQIRGVGPLFGPGGLTPTGHTASSNFQTQGQLISAGINYRFLSP